MTQEETRCSKCGHVITDEAQDADLAQRKPCPKCGAGILIEKKTKKEEVLACLKKECGYKEELKPAESES